MIPKPFKFYFLTFILPNEKVITVSINCLGGDWDPLPKYKVIVVYEK